MCHNYWPLILLSCRISIYLSLAMNLAYFGEFEISSIFLVIRVYNLPLYKDFSKTTKDNFYWCTFCLHECKILNHVKSFTNALAFVPEKLAMEKI